MKSGRVEQFIRQLCFYRIFLRIARLIILFKYEKQNQFSKLEEFNGAKT